MSTDLYGVRVLEIDRPARRVRLRVFVVYYGDPSAGHEPLPYEASILARMLWDAARWKDPHPGGMESAASMDDWLDEPWVDANAWRFIERFAQLSTRNTPITDPAAYAVCYYERAGRWEDEDELVQGDYDVWVTQERWLNGIVVGASFGSTSYATAADSGDLALADRLPEPQRSLATITVAPRPQEGVPLSVRPALLTASDDARWLAYGDEEGRLRVFDTRTWTVCHDSKDHGNGNGESLALAEFVPGEPTLLLPKRRSLTLPDGEVQEHARGVTPSGPSRSGGSGRLCVTRIYEGDYHYRWNVMRDGEVLFEGGEAIEEVHWALSGDDRFFAVKQMRHVELWDVSLRARTRTIEHPGVATAVAFSPDGTLLLLGLWQQEFKGFVVYEVATGREVRRVVGRDARPEEDRKWGDGKPSPVLGVWTTEYVALAEEFGTPSGETRGAIVRAFECGPPPPFAGLASERDESPPTA